MLTRRAFSLSLLAMPALSSRVAAQMADIESAIAGLDQLHSIQVRKGSETIFAFAPRGPGLDRVANIKSRCCSVP